MIKSFREEDSSTNFASSGFLVSCSESLDEFGDIVLFAGETDAMVDKVVLECPCPVRDDELITGLTVGLITEDGVDNDDRVDDMTALLPADVGGKLLLLDLTVVDDNGEILDHHFVVVDGVVDVEIGEE
jgi:hypothetical protein